MGRGGGKSKSIPASIPARVYTGILVYVHRLLRIVHPWSKRDGFGQIPAFPRYTVIPTCALKMINGPVPFRVISGGPFLWALFAGRSRSSLTQFYFIVRVLVGPCLVHLRKHIVIIGAQGLSFHSAVSTHMHSTCYFDTSQNIIKLAANFFFFFLENKLFIRKNG